MDQWAAIVPVVHEWLDQWNALLLGLRHEVVLALLFAPIVLAIFSRNFVLGLGCVTLVLAAGLVLLFPMDATVVFGSALYAGSIILSFSAIIARRRSKKIQEEVSLLHSQVNQLMAAESRRLLREINSDSETQAADASAD